MAQLRQAPDRRIRGAGSRTGTGPEAAPVVAEAPIAAFQIPAEFKPAAQQAYDSARALADQYGFGAQFQQLADTNPQVLAALR